MSLEALHTIRREGREPFRDAGTAVGVTLSDFWSWSASDLVSNSLRGVLAEFLIAHALELDLTRPREEWAAHDLTTADGVRIEVKSSAFVQSWKQSRLSPPTFQIHSSAAWDSTTGRTSAEAMRHSDVYVLALLAHRDKATVEPMNLEQWRFFVVSTRQVEALWPNQKSVRLTAVEQALGPPVAYAALKDHFDGVVRSLQSA